VKTYCSSTPVPLHSYTPSPTSSSVPILINKHTHMKPLTIVWKPVSDDYSLSLGLYYSHCNNIIAEKAEFDMQNLILFIFSI
jgi:hypothetical protein